MLVCLLPLLPFILQDLRQAALAEGAQRARPRFRLSGSLSPLRAELPGTGVEGETLAEIILMGWAVRAVRRALHAPAEGVRVGWRKGRKIMHKTYTFWNTRKLL